MKTKLEIIQRLLDERHISAEEALVLMEKEEKIFAGMIPKLDNAFTAIGKGVRKVIIGNADSLEDLVSGKKGTTII